VCPEPLIPLLALGDMPLANALLSEDMLKTPEKRYPLTLAFCPSLALVQIVERIPPEELFSDYPYFSSMSDGMLKSAKSLVERLVARRRLRASSLAVEIASNDGYLLQYYKAHGIPVLGIEPAANVAAVAERERGIPTLVEFFSKELGERLGAEGRKADVIHANNVFAHVPDPIGFLRGIAALLAPSGIAVIEAPYVKDMIDHVEFDTIYHEHLFYYSLTSVSRLCGPAGLQVIDVERLPIHGGSLRYTIAGTGSAMPSAAVTALLAEEQGWGVGEVETYRPFVARVEAVKRDLLSYLRQAKQGGKRIAAYGASAKGTTLLNYCGIDGDLIDFVVDRSPHKQGRYTPGTHLKIEAPQALYDRRPDEVLLLSWNFADEILEQQAEYRTQGGRFIVPVPQLRVV
jgi:SAM-dependent methyltransferase